jgi:hypothetical protein
VVCASRNFGLDWNISQTRSTSRAIRSSRLLVWRTFTQFVFDQQQRPERAWQALADLRGVIGQLQELYPSRAFRQR